MSAGFFKRGLRYLEQFLAVFMAARIVFDSITKGWGGVDLAATWADAGSYLPWWAVGWCGTWLVLTVAAAVWSWRTRPEPVHRITNVGEADS